MRKRTAGLAVLGAAAVAAAPLLRPGPDVGPGEFTDIDQAVDCARATGLTGPDLVRWCTEHVGAQFALQTLRSPWEPAAVAFRRRRGYSLQYNGALAEILSRLGFDAELVFAARVRRAHTQPPWYAMGHAWVRVTLDGRRRAACARYGGMGGEDGFLPLTVINPVRPVTLVDATLGSTALALLAHWYDLLGNKGLPSWFETPFDAAPAPQLSTGSASAPAR